MVFSIGRSIWAVFSIALIVSGCQTGSPYDPNSETYDTMHLHNGVSTTSAVCNKGEFTVWVSIDGEGDCIRYYPSFGTGSTAVGKAVAFFFGDITYTTTEKAYPNLKASRLKTSSEKWLRALKVDYIVIARPGTLGSTGYHKDRRWKDGREGRLINAALSEIMRRHGIEEITVAGHSGGANIAAQLMTYRSDIGCVVLASGALNLREAYSRYAYYPDFDQYIGNHWDPIDHVATIPRNESRRVFLIVDHEDQVVQSKASTTYHKAMKKHGHQATLLEGQSKGDRHHDLDHSARYLAGDCAKGKAIDEIIANATNGGRKG